MYDISKQEHIVKMQAKEKRVNVLKLVRIPFQSCLWKVYFNLLYQDPSAWQKVV